MIFIVSQPIGSRQCGQCCVAMILGITREAAIDLVGKKGGTYARDIRNALAKRNVSLGPVVVYRKPVIEAPPGLLLVRCRFNGTMIEGEKRTRWTHWMLWDAESSAMLCPGRGPFPAVRWPEATRPGQVEQITSSYEVRR